MGVDLYDKMLNGDTKLGVKGAFPAMAMGPTSVSMLTSLRFKNFASQMYYTSDSKDPCDNNMFNNNTKSSGDLAKDRKSAACKSEHQKFMSRWLDASVKDNFANEDRIGAFSLGASEGQMGMDGRPVVNLMWNLTAVHGLPIMVQEMYNRLNKVSRKNSEVAEEKVKMGVTLHPLPRTQYENRQRLNEAQFAIGFNTMLAFAFVSIFGLVFIVQEKELEIKLQQFVNGVPIGYYWFSNIFFDFSMYLFPVGSVLFVNWCFGLEILIGERVIAGMVSLLLLFSAAQPLFSYVTAHFFKSADNALSVAMFANLIMGFILFLAGFILELVRFPDDPPTRSTLKIVAPFVRFWPVYALAEGLRRIILVGFTWISAPPETRTPEYWTECEEKLAKHEIAPHMCAQSVMDPNGAGDAVISLAVDVVLYWLLAYLIDWAQQDVTVRQKICPAGPTDIE